MRLSIGMTVVVSIVSLVGPGLGLVRPQGTRESGPSTQVVTSATFHGLGDLPGGTFFSEANAVSADGSVVVGRSETVFEAFRSYEAFRWTRAQGMVGMGFLPEGVVAGAASDVSADGSVIIGTTSVPGESPWSTPTTISFRWTADSGFVTLAPLSEFYFPFQARAHSVSADGSVIVGEHCEGGGFGPVFCQAFRWTPDEGMIFFADPGLDSTAAAVSADGSIVIGSVETGPSPCDCVASGGCGAMHDGFLWTRSGGMTTLGLPPAGCSGDIVSAVSADGRTVVGSHEHLPFLWTAGTGMVFIENFEGPSIWANAISADGSVVVGTRTLWQASRSEAFLWDADHGVRSLRSLLVDEHGLDLTGWTLTSANGVSDDGLTIVGTGVDPGGSTEGWIATLPPKDTDGDGVPDIADACQDSNTEETLSIGTCETGLPNVVDNEGCTLADSLASLCPFATGTNVGREAATNAHGAFVGCVAHLADDWRSAGRIDRGQQGRVIACASKAGAPNLPSGRPIP